MNIFYLELLTAPCSVWSTIGWRKNRDSASFSALTSMITVVEGSLDNLQGAVLAVKWNEQWAIITRPGKRLQFATLKMVIEIVDFPNSMVDLSIAFCMSDFSGDVPLKSINAWWLVSTLWKIWKSNGIIIPNIWKNDEKWWFTKFLVGGFNQRVITMASKSRWIVDFPIYKWFYWLVVQ